MQLLHILDSTSMDSISYRSYRTGMFTVEKNPHISGPVLVKLMLLKYSLYFIDTSALLNV